MKKVLSLLLAFVLITSSFTCTSLLPATAANENLWTKRTGADIVKFSAPYLGLNSSNATGFSFWNPEYTYFCVKMPELESGKKYKFSAAFNGLNANVSVVDFGILNKTEFGQMQSNTSNYYSFPSSVKKLVSNTSYGATPIEITPYEFTADGTEYYLGFRMGGSTNKTGTAYLYLSNISLTEVSSDVLEITVTDGSAMVDGETVSSAKAGEEITLSFNDASDKIFKKWEVMSNNVTLADETNPNTSFIMPNESVSIKAVYGINIWSNIVSEDVKSYSGYGGFTGYNGSKKQLNLNTMFWQSVSVKLPELKKNTIYKISMDRSFGSTIQGNGTGSLSNFTMNLISQTEHDLASNTIPSGYIKQLSDSSALIESISAEFTTGEITTYYLAIRVNGTYGDLSLNNLVLEEIGSVPEQNKPADNYYENSENWGLYSSSAVDGAAPNKSGWQKASNSTAEVKTGNNSLKIEGNGKFFAVPLEMDSFTVGKRYVFKFHYYVPEGATMFNNKSWFDHICVIKKGTTVDSNGMPLISDVIANGPIATWNTISVTFEVADETQLFFGFRTGMGAGSQFFYIDDVSIIEAADNYLENSANWGLYSDSLVDGNGPIKSGWQQAINSNSQVKIGNNSLKIEGNGKFFAVPLEMNKLIIGKRYVLKFQYYIPEGATKLNNKSWFDHISIIEKGTMVDSNGMPSITNVVADGSAKTWNTMSIAFEVKDNTPLFFGFRTGMGEGNQWFYIDDISIDYAVDNYFENSEHWGMYSSQEVDGTGPNKLSWQQAANTTSMVLVGNNSLKIEGNGKYFAIPLEMDKLTVGKSYVLKFQYYVPNGSTMFNNNSWFDHVGIIPEGTTTDLHGNTPDGGIIANGPIATWNTMEVTFKVRDNTQLYFGLRTGMGTGGQLFYMDDVSLAEGVGSNVLHPGPSDVLTLDFDKDFKYSFTPADRMAVEETKDRNGKTTKALHIFEGVYSSTVFPNWDTVRSDKDLILSFPVKEYSAYEVSVWVKVETLNDANIGAYLGLFYDYDSDNYSANQITYTPYNKIFEKGGWQQYTITFTAAKGQEYASFGIDASRTPSSVWIDDIVYKEIKPGVLDETELCYCEDYFNLALQSDLDISDKITKNTTLKIPLVKAGLYTLGIDLSGSGRVIFSSDAQCKKILKAITVSGVEKRIGYNMWLSEIDGGFYIHFIPDSSGIAYKDLHLFASKAISLGSDMGYAENINYPEREYNPVYVNGDFPQDSNNQSNTIENSPQTGDNSYLICVIILLSLSGLLVVASRKRYNEFL